MKFLFDNNLPPRLARAIAVLCEADGHKVIHISERFKANTPDIEWVTVLIEEGGWVVISNDRFDKNPLEKKAFRSSGLITFVLKKGWKNIKMWDRAWRLIKWWPHIMQQSELVDGGVFEVPMSGNKLQPMKV